MASCTNTTAKPSSSRRNQSVSNMIKQGFISDPLLSPSRLNPLSSPPHPPASRSSTSPSLFEMMSIEKARDSKPTGKKLQDRVSDVLSTAPFEKWGEGDVRLTVGESDGFRVSMDVHRRVLAGRSRFFAEKLRGSGMHSVEILECDDVAVYVETVVLMYCDEVKSKLIGMGVSKILSILKISSAIMFDDGITACLRYLEAVPWSEEEEESVVSHLNRLQLDGPGMDTVLQRVTTDPSTSSRADEIFLQLSLGLFQAKDDKARKEMKLLISRLLTENDGKNSFHGGINVSRETLYHLCNRCLSSLNLCLSEATCLDERSQDRGALMSGIAREADNLQWIVGILIDRKMGDEFVRLWADQTELSVLHSKIPTVYRHEISKVTAQLCISIGRGDVLVPKDTRFALLSTWLEALYDDFGWMRTAGKQMNRRLIEEGLARTILTLPLPQQQSILLNWFDRFLNKGDDCPNIQGAFEIWWRRAFVKQYVMESQLQITVCDIPHL